MYNGLAGLPQLARGGGPHRMIDTWLVIDARAGRSIHVHGSNHIP